MFHAQSVKLFIMPCTNPRLLLFLTFFFPAVTLWKCWAARTKPQNVCWLKPTHLSWPHTSGRRTESKWLPAGKNVYVWCIHVVTGCGQDLVWPPYFPQPSRLPAPTVSSHACIITVSLTFWRASSPNEIFDSTPHRHSSETQTHRMQLAVLTH